MSSYDVSPGQFFELFRMDFVLDSEANVFLLEVNMSPNLSSQTHPENGALYRAVLKNAFQMMELSSAFRPVEWESRICALPQPIDCSHSAALFCNPCLSFDQSLLLAQISSEYLNKNWY